MRFCEAVTLIRRRMGITVTAEDVVWFAEKVVRENREVFDRLARI